MQKKIIALAIAGLASSAAFAQSNVTIYGVMDITQAAVKASGGTAANSNLLSRTRLDSNSSLIGFKGSEDLGGGMKAIFQYESGIAADVAGAVAGGRDTYVGLTGGFGTVLMGTLTHPIRLMGAKVDMNPGATSSAFVGSIFGKFAGFATGTDNRATNTLAYVTPSFSGFTVTGAYINGEARSADGAAVSTKTNSYQIAGEYENGPLYVGLGYHYAKDPQAAGAIAVPGTPASGLNGQVGANVFANGAYNDKLKDWRLAASYKLPSNTTLSALWDSQKYDQSANAAATNAKRTAWMVAAKQSFGVTDVWLEYAKANDVSGGVCSVAGFTCGDTGSHQWTLGASYSLSKRTMVHGYYTKITNDRAVAYDFYVNGAGITAANNGSDPEAYGVGIRHTF